MRTRRTTPTAARRRLLPARAAAALLVLGALALGVTALPVTPAAAATKVVTLGAGGPSPTSVSLKRGDVVQFVNDDTVKHFITRTSGAWSFEAEVAPNGGKKSTSPFYDAGSFGYSDQRNGVIVTSASGTIAVAKGPAPASSPTPTPKAQPSATRSPTPRPTTSPAARPSASSSPAAVPTDGTAVLPGLGTGLLPTPSTGASAGPKPAIAPQPSTGATGAAGTQTIRYDGRFDDTSAARSYGLPAALAVVALLGLLSLLVRLLLAHPSAHQSLEDRRTGST